MSQHTSSHEHSHNDGDLYLKVLGALLVLTVVTVIVSAKVGIFQFGAWALAVAMIIASAKALLVVLFFMHLKYENPLTWLYAIFPLILLAIMMGGIFIDNPMRRDESEGTFIEERVKAEKSALLEKMKALDAASEHH